MKRGYLRAMRPARHILALAILFTVAGQVRGSSDSDPVPQHLPPPVEPATATSDGRRSDVTPPVTEPPSGPEPPQPVREGDIGLRDDINQRIRELLPSSISDGLEIDAWAWFANLHNNLKEDSNYWDGEVSFGIVKSFHQRVAVGLQVNLIDANDDERAELEKGYLSARLSDAKGTILTLGKFNAEFGVEQRDFWNRVTGTPSPLFGAQPQDLIGAMLTQSIGNTGLKIRPFVSIDFQGAYNVNQPPSGGAVAEYAPDSKLKLSVTNWVGPGFVAFGGRHLQSPYERYGDEADPGSIVENWQGPNLYATSKGTLYFVEASAQFQPFPDLSLSAEYLLGTTGTSNQREGWQGWMVLVDYDLTDRLHLFARYSYLSDTDWIITGIFQRHQEESFGAGYHLTKWMELRAEYRHDYSNAVPGVDTVSVHLSLVF